MPRTPQRAHPGRRPARHATPHLRAAAAIIGAVVLVVAAGCRAGSIAGPLQDGVWGGPQGNLTVYADSATLDLACAAGRIQGAVVAGADGSFDLPGMYAPQVGPIPAGGPDWQPASFRGTRSGDDLSLTILTSSGNSIGPLQLHRGTVGRFARCL